MAKNRKYQDETPQADPQVEVAQTEVQTTEDAAPIKPKAPSIFLRAADGTEYHFDRRNNLPRKAAVVGNVQIDGTDASFQMTSNKGWTPPENVIEYIWLTLPGDNVSGFITLDYLKPAMDFVGTSFTRHEGKAARANPARIPKSLEAEAARIAAAKATLEAKALLKAQAEAEAAAAEPAAEATMQ